MRHRGELLLASPGKSREDDIELGVLCEPGGQVPDVVPDSGTDAKQRGGVQRDSHTRMFAHGVGRP